MYHTKEGMKPPAGALPVRRQTIPGTRRIPAFQDPWFLGIRMTSARPYSEILIPMEEQVVESCLACNVKVRVLKDKVAQARCPKCKGPLGDPKVDQRCRVAECGAVNRVLRSKLLQARCGKCKEPLVAEGQATRDLVLSEAQAIVGQLFAEPRLVGKRARPADLAEVVDLLKAMPQTIAELAASQPLGPDRDRLAALSARCKNLVGPLRPFAFEQPAMLLNEPFVQHYMLTDAFESLRQHPLAWESLKTIRRQDTGLTVARQELVPASDVFDRLVGRLHKTDWNNMDEDKAKRTRLADKLLMELSKQVETWAIRPIKLEGMVMGAMSRMKELAGGGDEFGKVEGAIREDVTAFLALATVVTARGVDHHKFGGTLKESWQALYPSLRGKVMAAV